MMYRSICSSILILFVISIIWSVTHYHYIIYHDIILCEKCMYSNCSSKFVISSCGNIQNDNMDKYFSHLRNYPVEMDRIMLYSQMYGKNMEECFFNSRHYCLSTHCKNQCDSNQEEKIQYSSNIVKEREGTIIIDSIVGDYMAQFDSCYAENIDIREMYSKCVLSPFKDNCTLFYSKNAIINC